MEIKYLFLVLLFHLINETQAQPKHSFSLNTGYAFNTSIELDGEAVEKSRGYILNLGFSYRLFKNKWMYSEIGLSGKSIFSSGNLDNRSFNGKTLRLAIPINLVFPISTKKLQFSTGVILQNNVDFSKFDFRLRDNYSWRINALLETRYLLKNQMYLMIGVNWNLRNNIPDSYFVNDPKISFLVGISKWIDFSKNKKNKHEK